MYEAKNKKNKKMSKEVSENQSQKNSQAEIYEKSTITIIWNPPLLKPAVASHVYPTLAKNPLPMWKPGYLYNQLNAEIADQEFQHFSPTVVILESFISQLDIWLLYRFTFAEKKFLPDCTIL